MIRPVRRQRSLKTPHHYLKNAIKTMESNILDILTYCLQSRSKKEFGINHTGLNTESSCKKKAGFKYLILNDQLKLLSRYSKRTKFNEETIMRKENCSWGFFLHLFKSHQEKKSPASRKWRHIPHREQD